MASGNGPAPHRRLPGWRERNPAPNIRKTWTPLATSRADTASWLQTAAERADPVRCSAVTDGALPDVSFHDAEVLAIRVDRVGPTVEVEVEALPNTPRAARYILRFGEVSDLELGGVNEQNVLFDLTAAADPHGWDVRLEPSYGLGAAFTCRTIEYDADP